MGTKRCAKCHQQLPLTTFYQYRNRPYSYCKSCHNLKVVKWQKSPFGRAAAKRSQKKYKKKYYGSERGRAVVAAYRSSPKYKTWQQAYNRSETGKARSRRYWRSQKGRAAQLRHRQSEKTKATLARLKAIGRPSAYRRKYLQSQKGKAMLHRQNISGKGKARMRRYRQSEKGRTAMAAVQRRHALTEKGRQSRMRYEFKRRTAIRQAKNTLTWREWKEILDQHNRACFYCGATDIKLERDHIIPVIPRDPSLKGGDHVKENIVPACRRCNASKSNKILSSLHLTKVPKVSV